MLGCCESPSNNMRSSHKEMAAWQSEFGARRLEQCALKSNTPTRKVAMVPHTYVYWRRAGIRAEEGQADVPEQFAGKVGRSLNSCQKSF